MVSLNIILMKRIFTERVGSSGSQTKSKELASPLVGPVFQVTHISPSTSLSNSVPAGRRRGRESRVQASSKVNFSKLTPAEQRQRYVNQKAEIKRLKKLLHKYSAECDFLSLQQFYPAFNGDEQKALIENTCKAIISGRMLPNSLGYNQVCTILRDLLQLPCSDNGYSISLPDKRLNISSVEYESYAKVPCTDSILLKIIGREHQDLDDPLVLLQLFNGSSALAKTE